jgi:hypothetical protein
MTQIPNLEDAERLIRKHALRAEESYLPEQIAARLHCSRDHVDRLIRKGDLVATRVSVDPDKAVRTHKVIVTAANLARFLEAREGLPHPIPAKPTPARQPKARGRPRKDGKPSRGVS